MRGSLVQLTPFVLLDRVSPINVQWLVGIHRDDDFSNECVDASFFKSAHKWEKGRHGCGYCHCLVTKLCSILCHPVDCSLPGSSVHGISQARILEWVTISFFGTFLTRDRTHVSCSGRRILYHWATREAQVWLSRNAISFLQVSYFQENQISQEQLENWHFTLLSLLLELMLEAVSLWLLLVEKTSRG